MQTAKRKLAFVLAATGHGTMILSRFDHHTAANGQSFGVVRRSSCVNLLRYVRPWKYCCGLMSVLHLSVCPDPVQPALSKNCR